MTEYATRSFSIAVCAAASGCVIGTVASAQRIEIVTRHHCLFMFFLFNLILLSFWVKVPLTPTVVRVYLNY